MDELRDHLVLHAEQLAEEFVDADTGAPPDSLGPLGLVNILVGANSAGKSRLLRALAARSRHVLATQEDANRITSLIALLDRYASSGLSARIKFKPGNNPDPVEIGPSAFAGAREGLLTLVRGEHIGKKARQEEHARALYLVENLGAAFATPRTRDVALIGRPTGFDVNEMKELVDIDELAKRLERPSPKRVLIPALRSAQTLWHGKDESIARLGDDVFATTFRHRYRPPLPVKVWTGAELYGALMRWQCAPKESREMKLAFERFLARTFFPGRHVELVPLLGEDLSKPFDSHVNFVLDDVEHALFDVGDGIGALTTLLFPLFNAEPDTWAFIEEPENHLHPAYQRTFLEALLSDPLRGRLRIFLTTHSNHLLDIAMERPEDISVLSLSQRQTKLSIRHSQGRDVRVLDTLGVRNSSVYLANCSIWVEGPTDVTYLRAFLEIAMIERYGATDAQDEEDAGRDASDDDGRRHPFQEDLHFAFLEYGGSLLANYDFGDDVADDELNAAAIANRMCIIADLDEGKDKKHERWRTRAEASHGALRYLTTTGREIENELSPQLVTMIVRGRLDGAELPAGFELAACGPTEYLATFLVGAFGSHPAAERVARWKKRDGGTFVAQAKRDFAQQAAKLLSTGSDAERSALLGDQARTLAMAVLDFVESHNKGVFATKDGTPPRG